MLAVSVSNAAPLFSLGDNADVFFNLQTGVKADSNVTAAAANERDDVIFTVRPGLELDLVRGESQADGSLIVQSTNLRYSDNEIYDAENLGVFANGSYEDVVYSFGGALSFVEDQTTTQRIDLDGLLESETFDVSGYFRYDFTQKVGVRIGAQFTNLDYVGVFDDQLPDRETVTLPLKFFYAYSPKLDITAGFRYRNADIDNLGTVIGNDPEDIQFTVGVEGELLPKLVGSVDVGYQERSFQTGSLDDTDTLTLAAALEYAFSPKLGLVFSANRDFESVSDGNPIESTSANFQLNYSYNEFWSISGNLGLLYDDFKASNREDETITLGVSGQYTPNGYLALGAIIYYANMDSNEDRDFDKTVVEFTATLRY